MKKGTMAVHYCECTIYTHNFYWWYNQLHENYKRRYIVVLCAVCTVRGRETSWGNKWARGIEKKDEGGHSDRLTVDCMTLASWHFYAIASNLIRSRACIEFMI
jgi:hypothetical protein